MREFEGLAGLRSLPAGCALSIGNYDGVHVGHQSILAELKRLSAGGPTAVVTFEPHPLTVLRPGHAPPRLTTVAQRRDRLAALGINHLVALTPTPDLLGLTASEFWQILRDDVRPAHIVEGQSFNFGKDRGGTIERLIEWSADTAVHVHRLGSETRLLQDRTVVDVSSSLIRWLLGYGRVEDAAICLGRPYELAGTVVQGFQRGRTIGVPTANLDCGDQLVPADGVYAGECTAGGRDFAVALSVGTAPTFAQGRYQIEAHLIGYSGDLYGQSLTLRVTRWLRDQCKFPSLDLLKEQLSRDISAARHQLAAAAAG